MSDLENVFGEEFAKDYRQEIQKRREERLKVSEDAEYEIANQAINEGKFKDGDPMFSVVTDADVTHDVLLMQLPNPEGKSIFGYTNELDTGAVTCPLDYMGEWINCLFNEPDDLRQMEPDDHYIIIGDFNQWETDDGEMRDQVSPVRGVLSLPQAKRMADEFLDGEVNESSPDTEDEEDVGDESGEVFEDSGDDNENDEEESEDSSGGGLDGFLSEEEEEEDEPDVSYMEVSEIVETLADREDAVWDLEEGDERLDKVAKITVNQLELDEDDFDTVKSLVVKRIEEESEEEEEDKSDEDKMF